MSIERRVENETIVSRLDIQTANRQLPLAPLAELVPSLRRLGAQATFSGALWLEEADQQWRGELTGTLAHVDLDALVTEQFPHKLSGAATLRVEKAKLDAGRLVAASLSILAGPGVIENSLIDAAVEHAGMRRKSAMRPADRFIAYDQLAVAVDIAPDRMTLRGQCEGAEAGALLVSLDAVLLLEPEKPASNALGIVRMLAPRGDLQVPATAETQSLLDRVPLPAAKPQASVNPPRARVRFDIQER
jgi:hypothetical protein